MIGPADALMKKGLRLAEMLAADVLVGPADALMKKGLRPFRTLSHRTEICPADALMKKGLRLWSLATPTGLCLVRPMP